MQNVAAAAVVTVASSRRVTGARARALARSLARAPDMFLLRHVRVGLMAAAAAFGAAVFMAINLFYNRRVWTPEDYCAFKEVRVHYF